MKNILIGPITFLMLVSVASAQQSPKQIWQGSEMDAVLIGKLSDAIASKLRAEFAKTDKAVRDAHAKAHGCVKAALTVSERLEGSGLDQGVFAKGGTSYKAWIRFSNGSGDPSADDRVAGARGMAIKLFGVEGAKFMDDEKSTQDFQMIDHPVFFVKNVADYIQFSADGKEFFATHLQEAAVVGAISNPTTNAPKHPVESTYHSMTPRQWGPVDKMRPVKFAAKPIPCVDGQGLPSPVLLKDSPDALRIALSETLASRDACFAFQVQQQSNDTDMPVDDPVKLWDPSVSKFQTVAKIVINKQSFESAAQKTFCEDLSITPWHSIADHQPLGGIELARKPIYETISKLRHELNQRPRVEPTGDETFHSQ